LSILLDTHVWIWWLTGAPEMKRQEREAIDKLAASQLPFISSISIWESEMLVSKNRLLPKEPFESWIRRMTAPDTVRIVPLDTDVIISLHSLPKAFHGDPADRLIVATARAHGLALATHDSVIRRSRLASLWK
jgi:PIN domain nuclease of toxin-antitoxin system